MSNQVKVRILGMVITSRYGTLTSGRILETDKEFAKHLVEDCDAAEYVKENVAQVPAPVSIPKSPKPPRKPRGTSPDKGSGDQGSGDQGNGDQGNGDQSNGDQGNGDQGDGDQGDEPNAPVPDGATPADPAAQDANASADPQ